MHQQHPRLDHQLHSQIDVIRCNLIKVNVATNDKSYKINDSNESRMLR